MTLLNKYITKEILKVFLLVIALILGIFVAVDYLGTMDEFIHAKISLVRALEYVLLKIPFITIQLIPVALILSILIVFGIMSKNNEIVILRSSGISVFYLIKPVIALGFIFALLIVVLQEVIVPITMIKSNMIKNREIRKEKAHLSKGENIWIKEADRMVHIKFFDPGSKTIFNTTCFYFGKDFTLARRIDAENGEYSQGKWTLHNSMEQTMDKTGSSAKFHETLSLDLGFRPQDLNKVVKKSEEMNFMELWHYTKKIESEGYDATSYRVDLYAKTAFPFLALIMCIIGTGLTARGKLTKGLPVSISYGIGIAFLYWVGFSFCRSLGYGGILPPFIAAWICNIIFICWGGISLLSAL